MLVPKKSLEQRKAEPKQNLIDALFEKHRDNPSITTKELKIFAEGYKRAKLNRRERGYRVD
jgi:hypothetical protein